jgi:hypothetical protein
MAFNCQNVAKKQEQLTYSRREDVYINNSSILSTSYSGRRAPTTKSVLRAEHAGTVTKRVFLLTFCGRLTV